MKRASFGTTLLVGAILAGWASVLVAQGEAPVAKPPQWWEIATGILAIPAAIVGLVYSYVLIGKTRLESRKTELEIREKEAQLRELPKAQRDAAAEIIAPFMQGQISQYLILRFILLYIVLGLWDLVQDVFDLAFTGVMVTAQSVYRVDLNQPWVMIPAVLLQQLPRIGHWVLFLALALPLFRDANRFVGLSLKQVLSIRRQHDA